MNVIARPKDMSIEDIMNVYDSRWGRVPADKLTTLKEGYNHIMKGNFLRGGYFVTFSYFSFSHFFARSTLETWGSNGKGGNWRIDFVGFRAQGGNRKSP
jgi:hypothetical protein